MSFAQRHAISDTCVLVRDLETSIGFYRDKLGFALLHRAPGFADFSGAGHTLALWERTHIAENTGVPVDRSATASVVIAIKLASPAEVDASYEELLQNGLEFVSPPADYSWNARCVYFVGPDGEIWELYAWLPDGPAGEV